MKKNNENTNAFLIHISAFAGFMFPFGNIITPLIAWQTLKDRSVFLDEQGKEAVNFNISYTLYVFLISIVFIPFAFGSIFNNHRRHFNWNNFNLNLDFDTHNLFGFLGFGSVAGLVYIIGIALVIIASIKAREGENYKYPLTIKFIK
ncbi:hypothetical protein BW723_15205 [Polaribacter reichenbachii]|uniref:DUF4870 domain-containing protein n=1 Tax=Polaribacter reichenbachii TaxID=996801 RepID=A0A1B8U5F2_9FLAO|nr:DUF4870 domain-containing protein [Polaribacter reichenbachii]APZ47550.1 hypothetical protein BW723_15205 [Polaribacter reichenbachii]AUC18190.1 hypothetical protein BTO17_05650 [Polaribacter reichenbachii]OBY67097.1 hypothetical protein LPB301_04585 [Polaribacter reichenbachii]